MPLFSGGKGHRAPHQGGSPRAKWVILGTVLLGTFSTTLDGGIVSISSPALVEAFSSDPSTVLWVATAYFLTSVSLLLTVAWVADNLGRKRMYVAGYLVFAVGLALASLAPSIIALVLIRVLQAVGGAMIVANTNAIITGTFPSNERGQALGLANGVVGLGLGMGPLVGGLLLDALDWRALFWSRIPVAVLAMVMAMAVLPRDHRRGGHLQVDYLGPLVLCVTAVSGLLAINLAGRGGAGQPVVWALAGATPLLIAVLIAVERRVPLPVLDLAQFRNRIFATAEASLFFHFVSTGMVAFLTAFFLVDGLGLTAGRAGLVLTVFSLVRLVGSPVSGAISDRVGTRGPTVVGLLGMAGGLLVLSQLGQGAPLWQVAGALALAGLGSAVFEPANTSAIMGSVKVNRLGSAAALLAAGRQVSLSVGFALGGAIFAFQRGTAVGALREGAVAGGSSSVVAAYGDAMLVAAALVVVGAVVAYARGRA